MTSRIVTEYPHYRYRYGCYHGAPGLYNALFFPLPGISGMPIYEYECGECGHVFETLQRISDAPLSECPACGKPALKKLVSAAAFRLKGGGWYETDFKTGNKKNVDQGDKKAGKDSDAKAASGSTPKPKKTGDSG